MSSIYSRSLDNVFMDVLTLGNGDWFQTYLSEEERLDYLHHLAEYMDELDENDPFIKGYECSGDIYLLKMAMVILSLAGGAADGIDGAQQPAMVTADGSIVVGAADGVVTGALPWGVWLFAKEAEEKAEKEKADESNEGEGKVKELLKSGKTPEELIRQGYSVDDIIKAGGKVDDIPAYNHITQGEGVARGNKPGVKGAHNADAFDAAIEADAKRLGVSVDDYNITKTPHPTVEGVYEIKYDVVKENGLGKPLRDSNNNVQTRPSYEVKTVYDPKIISDEQMYDMGRKALESQINIGKTGTITGENNGLKFKGHVQSDGKLDSFYPIID